MIFRRILNLLSLAFVILLTVLFLGAVDYNVLLNSEALASGQQVQFSDAVDWSLLLQVRECVVMCVRGSFCSQVRVQSHVAVLLVFIVGIGGWIALLLRFVWEIPSLLRVHAFFRDHLHCTGEVSWSERNGAASLTYS